jgi:hypothetical protein
MDAYISAVPHSVSGPLNGAVDYCQGTTTMPTTCGTYHNTYNGGYTYPNPLQGGGGTPQANSPGFSPSTGIPPQTVMMTCSTGGSTGCYTTDGSSPTAPVAGTCSGGTTHAYSAPISVSVNPTTLNGICTGVGLLNSAQASATYAGSPSVCSDPLQAAPNFSGPYLSPPTTLPLTINFTSPTPGCGIRYLTGGGSPTCLSPSLPGGGLNISSTTTVITIACQAGFLDSSTSGGTWNITVSHTLTASAVGPGTISCTPSGSGISAGTPYSCAVTPTGGGSIASVSGCGGSGTNPYTGTMPNADCAITATFSNPVVGTPTGLSAVVQ